ncbi:hypothetical protein H072_375 [Dactylellina haptotyla CBS 200.50]|uniref:Uncharacterized protein n=1 Tax=Dactylellina haptotyla (strain CBS 200.50) TaxID=1284197 RepID=S8ARL6_DACHA|nr:hypothetical protein H072_375 [Dactylellina haptotyla CBS 200.50]
MSILDLVKGKVGATWLCIANFVSFFLCILVFLGNVYENTSPFAMTSIDLHSRPDETLSFEVYQAENFTTFNPATSQLEQPRYLYFGFSGVCYIFQNSAANVPTYSRQCAQQFIQQLFLPNGTLRSNGAVRPIDLRIVDYTIVNQLWQAAAALTIVIMVFNVGCIVGTCADTRAYKYIIKFLWLPAIILTIPTIVLVLVCLTRIIRPLSAGSQMPDVGVFYRTEAGYCLGLGLFILAMLLTLVANPVLMIGLLCFIFFPVTIAVICVGCFRKDDAMGGPGDVEGGAGYEYQQKALRENGVRTVQMDASTDVGPNIGRVPATTLPFRYSSNWKSETS